MSNFQKTFLKPKSTFLGSVYLDFFAKIFFGIILAYVIPSKIEAN